MNPQVKVKPDDTKARIVEAAEALFRQLGYAKTTVADIAAELDMSPANVYRFFSSKAAIVDAICRRYLAGEEEKAWRVARSKAPATERMERLILEILAYHKEILITWPRIKDMVLAAHEHSWEAIRAHKQVMGNVTELILRDGIEAGEFEPVDPRATAGLIKHSIVGFTHPLLLGQRLEEGEDVEAEARALIRFLLRAIIVKR